MWWLRSFVLSVVLQETYHNVAKRAATVEFRSLWDLKGFALQEQCPVLMSNVADLDTVLIYPILDFETKFVINSSHLEGHRSVQQSWPRIKRASTVYNTIPNAPLFDVVDDNEHISQEMSKFSAYYSIPYSLLFDVADDKQIYMTQENTKFDIKIEPTVGHQSQQIPLLTLKLRFRPDERKLYYKEVTEPLKKTTSLLKEPVEHRVVKKAPLAPILRKPPLRPIKPLQFDSEYKAFIAEFYRHSTKSSSAHLAFTDEPDVHNGNKTNFGNKAIVEDQDRRKRNKCNLEFKTDGKCNEGETDTDNKPVEELDNHKRSDIDSEHTKNVEEPDQYDIEIEKGSKEFVQNDDKHKKTKTNSGTKTSFDESNEHDGTKQQRFQVTSPMTSNARPKSFTTRTKLRAGPKLKVFVVPFSHNNPGWLYTFEGYFRSKSKYIIDNVLKYLTEFPKLTFIWSEISFLEAWWRDSTATQRQTLKNLVASGRLEIVAGGWVMPDEACTHYYPLIDQFIEGHQWIKNNLGISPQSGWSVDSFGHGPTVPYILQNSGFTGTVIQRINFAWKRWLAMWQVSEFYWLVGWATRAAPTLVVHHLPFSLYDIRNSCGPDPAICSRYDFSKYPDNTEESLHNKSHVLIEQYRVIGALTPHNVALVPLGGDFKYNEVQELEIQYKNYMEMFYYINSHQELFNAEVQFGTVSDFFNAIKNSRKYTPKLKGDFFPYADEPHAFWSGFFTTRPHFKLLSRQFEHQLRSSEIMFSLVSNILKLTNSNLVESEKMFEQLVSARRSLGLFQHHDGITGTSRAFVMKDYERKMLKGIYQCQQMQQKLLSAIMFPIHLSRNVVESSLKWEVYRKPINVLNVMRLENKVIIFNPLAEPRTDVVTLQSSSPFVKIYDTRRNTYVQHQIGPSFHGIRMNNGIFISTSYFEVMFVASLPALAAVVFNIVQHFDKSAHSSVICDACNGDNYIFKVTPYSSNVDLENSYLKLFISNDTGFLRKIYRKDVKRGNDVIIQFGVYENTGSGAYLFQINRNEQQQQHKKQFWEYHTRTNAKHKTIIIKGPIATTIRTYHMPIIAHVMTIYNVEGVPFSRGVLLENLVDFDFPPLKQNIDLFMRIQTDIQNGEPPEFYTDQNGFQYQKRVKVDKVNTEANVYPVTTMAWLQDEDTRLTLLTDHTQGVSAGGEGRLELMLGRTTGDDGRGLEEGVTETKSFSQTWLLLESINKPSLPKNPSHKRPRKRRANAKSTRPTVKPKCRKRKSQFYELPSETAGHLSRAFNYPVQVYSVDMDGIEDELIPFQNFAYGFPAGLHLVTLRTMSTEYQRPNSSFLMLLHRPAYSCYVGNILNAWPVSFTKSSGFTGLSIAEVSSVSLTGLQKHGQLSGLFEIQIEPMEINTFKVTLNRYGYSGIAL